MSDGTRQDAQTATIAIDPRHAARILGAGIAMLLLARIGFGLLYFVTGHDNVWGLAPMFDVTLENNVPTWFSGVILALAALLLTSIARMGATTGSAVLGGSRPAHWYGLAGIFAYLSLDEIAQLHERTTAPVRGALDVGGVLQWAWVIPAAGAVAVVGLLYARFLLRLPRGTAVRFVVAGALYAGGAIGGDVLGGLVETIALTDGASQVAHWSISLVEEGCEMIGVALFIAALLEHVARSQRAELRLDQELPPPVIDPGMRRAV